jgi:hypothetical protein
MDSVTESGYIVKRNWVLQGNPLGPLLFDAATADSTGSEETRKQCHHYTCMPVTG